MIQIRSVTSVVIFVAALLGVAGCGKPSEKTIENVPASATDGALEVAAADAQDQPNVVQREMRSLESAMHAILTAIANNQLAPIAEKLFAIHEFRDATEKEIHEGRYHPPHEPGGIEAFIAADTAFHDDLVRLVKASRANDLKAATAAYGVIVNGCTSCHSRFRFGLEAP